VENFGGNMKKIKLNSNNLHFVFVYGTLKRGFGNHNLLKRSSFLGAAKTKEKYLMTCNSIPYLSDETKIAPVSGELYLVKEVTLKALDFLEGHPTFYQRKLITVIANGIEVSAWCYICNKYQGEKMGKIVDGTFIYD